MKMIRFDLPINGIRAKNKDDIRDNFDIEMLNHYKSGLLEKWLKARNLTEELKTLNSANGFNDHATFKILCEIFDVAADDQIISIILNEDDEGKNQPSTSITRINAILNESSDLKNLNINLTESINKLNVQISLYHSLNIENVNKITQLSEEISNLKNKTGKLILLCEFYYRKILDLNNKAGIVFFNSIVDDVFGVNFSFGLELNEDTRPWEKLAINSNHNYQGLHKSHKLKYGLL